MAKRVTTIAFGLACYGASLAASAYSVGFVGNYWAVFGWQSGWLRSLDGGEPAALGEAILVDVLLIAVFGLQHSVMARRTFKHSWTRLVSERLERSTFVLAASACLALLFWQWRPIGFVLFDVSKGAVGFVLVAVSLVGWLVVVRSTFLIDHAELFGLRQVFGAVRARSEASAEFRTPGLYRAVRHPIYLGFLVAFWSSPVMTVGHLLFAAGFTTYVLVAIPFEERDLSALYGERYRDYRTRVRALLPLPRLDTRRKP